MTRPAALLVLLTLAGCRSANPPATSQSPAASTEVPAAAANAPAATPPVATEPRLTDLFPHVRINRDARLVEFDTELSPLLTPDPRAPYFFLESVACTPDTREHESLVVSKARPSHIHAALLAVGLQPGSPGGWKLVDNRLIPVDATGDALSITFCYTDPASGDPRQIDPLNWIISINGDRPFRDAAPPGARWVFAGSRMVKAPRARIEAQANPAAVVPEVYDADGSGTLIGLTTFSSETIAWSTTISPDASTQEPEWIARMDALPPASTPIRVQIRPAPVTAGD
jgi:hypothetical protein